MAINPLDAFSADAQIASANQGAQALKQGLRKGKKFLKGGQKKAVGAIETKGYEVPRGDITTSLGQALPTIQAGQAAGQSYLGQGQGYIDTATGQQIGALQGASDLWGPIRDIGLQGVNAYGNFQGLGGAAGYQQAQQDWQNSPAYQAYSGQNDLLMQELNRQAAARGNPYNYADIQKYGGQLAGQYLNQFQQGYQPYFGLATTGTQGQAGLAQDISNVYGNAGTAKAGLAGQQAQMAYNPALAQAQFQQTAGQNLADISRGAAGNLSNIYTGTAQNLAQNAQQMGQAGYQQQADINAANNTAAQNQWNAILGLAGAGAQGVGAYYGQ